MREVLEGARDRLARNGPGVLLSITVGMAATFISNVYGGPTVLFALLLGMAFNFISAESRFAPGVALSSRSILRIGVALLGARITFEQIAGLGWQTMAGVACAVTLTILFGVACAPLAGMQRRFGVLTAGAVAICGASAAAAIAAVLPRSLTHDRDTAFTIIGVTALSTLAMVLYPLMAVVFHFTHAQTGVFLGGTIHDVAQVVGAGYSVSQESGDVATIIKLLRVALLVPAVLVISLLSRRIDIPGKRQAAGGGPAVSRRLRRHRAFEQRASDPGIRADGTWRCLALVHRRGERGPRHQGLARRARPCRAAGNRAHGGGDHFHRAFRPGPRSCRLRRFGPEPLTVARLHVF